MNTIRLTDSLPSMLTNIQYRVAPTLTWTSGSTNLDFNITPPSGAYAITVTVRGEVPLNDPGICAGNGGPYINRARASNSDCPLCNLGDADATVLYVVIPPVGPGSGGSFTISGDDLAICGAAPQTKTASIVISNTTGITWTDTVYEDDLEANNGVGPLTPSNVKVFINGVERTGDVTVTISNSAPRLRIEFDNIGVFSATAQISITYGVTAAANATTGSGIYFTRFTVGGVSGAVCGGGESTALNRVNLTRAELSNLSLAPIPLRSCGLNDILITVDGDYLDTTVSDRLVVTFTADASDIFTASQYVLGGGFPPTLPVTVTQSGNVVTFTFPVTFDLDAPGTIGFPLYRTCSINTPLEAELGYLDACRVPNTADAQSGVTTASNVQLLAQEITYTLNTTSTIWTFSVRNTGNQSATNVIISNTLPSGHSFYSYTVSGVSPAVANGVTYTIQYSGGRQVLIFRIAVLPAGDNMRFDVRNVIASCNSRIDRSLRHGGRHLPGETGAQAGFQAGRGCHPHQQHPKRPAAHLRAGSGHTHGEERVGSIGRVRLRHHRHTQIGQLCIWFSKSDCAGPRQQRAH